MKKIICLICCLVIIAASVPLAYSAGFSLDAIPEYSNFPYVTVNGGTPYFTESDKTTVSFESYSPLDSLGRCGVAYACVGIDLMPTEERGNIGSIKPSGWQSVKYDIVEGKYLYNRCHLIGYQLTAENANAKNLITGTRYLNTKGMLPFENMVADFIKEENAQGFTAHVLYRVTPVFEKDNLVASGVLMEALSVEDNGEGICFCVYCYNVQPQITLNYTDGSSNLEGQAAYSGRTYTVTVTCELFLNTNSKKYHMPDCASVAKTSEKNRGKHNGSIEELTQKGYTPCKSCKPDENAETTVSYFYGDINLNGRIEASDARAALRAAVGLDVLEAVSFTLADIDGNKQISSTDARSILRAAVGLESL